MKSFFLTIKKYIRNPLNELTMFNRYDIVLVLAVSVLIFVGIIESLSITPVRMADISLQLFFKHMVSIFLGLICFIFTAFVLDYKIYKEEKINYMMIFIIVIMLIAVIAVGKTAKGATRWIDLGIVNIQPSEFAKIVFAITAAKFLSKKQPPDESFFITKFLPVTFCFGLFAALIVLQKDLGTVVFLGIIYVVLLIISEAPLKFITIPATLLAAAAIPLVCLYQYRMNRILDYVASLSDWTKSSYNVKSAIIALGSGGPFGKGFGKSEMKLLHLPEAHTDFVFPIIGEEHGFIGVMIIIFLFIAILLRASRISRLCDDDFGKNLAFIIGVMFSFQAIINIGMSIGVLPAKGMPLPFISYGGSSMLYSLTTIGILFNISRKNKYGQYFNNH